jgi:hypothetical protein
VLKFYLRTVLALVIATLTTTLALRLFVESPLDELTLRLLGGHAAVHVQAIARVPPAERRAIRFRRRRTRAARRCAPSGAGLTCTCWRLYQTLQACWLLARCHTEERPR